MKAPLPPIPEQRQILAHIQEATTNINQAITRAEREIDLIQEYRTALLSEVVTGRLDLRRPLMLVQRKKPNPHFCRSVLAAEIVERLRSTPEFGRVKLQKAMILVERHLQLDEIQSRPRRAAAGPFDNKMMRSIHAQLERQKWFKPVKKEIGYAYLPMEKCGGHRRYFDRYWGNKDKSFDELMRLIKPMTMRQAEIVATLYSAWNDFLICGEQVDDDRVVNEVLHRWDQSKQRIPEEKWRAAIAWMRKKELVPQGFGAATIAGAGNEEVKDADDRHERKGPRDPDVREPG
jgi:type I restriction enzyme S subunit